MFNIRAAGRLFMIIGICIGAVCHIIIYKDMKPEGVFDDYYTYRAPFSIHESFMVVLLFFAPFMLLIGAVCMAASRKKA